MSPHAQAFLNCLYLSALVALTLSVSAAIAWLLLTDEDLEPDDGFDDVLGLFADVEQADMDMWDLEMTGGLS